MTNTIPTRPKTETVPTLTHWAHGAALASTSGLLADRFSAWTQAGLWRRLHRAVLDELGGKGLIDRSRAVIDAASVRAKKGDRRPGRVRSTAARPPHPRCDSGLLQETREINDMRHGLGAREAFEPGQRLQLLEIFRQ